MPKPEAVQITLHIGLEKTGTSTIQGFLNAHRDALLEHGILFPTSPGRINQTLLPAAAMSRMQDIRAHAIKRFGEDFALDLVRGLRAEIARSSADRMILSSEHCAARLHTVAEVERLRGIVEAFGAPTRIVVYLRRQDEYLTSLYSTGIRTGQTQPFRIPANAKARRRYDYRAILELWSGVFGREAVRPRLFQPSAWTGGTLLTDFCDAAELPIGDPRAEIRNQSMSAETLELLRRINERTGARRDRTLIQAAMRVTGDGPKLSLGTAARRAFVECFADSNRWVAETFLGRSALFDDVPDGLPDTPLPTLSAERFAAMWAAVEAIRAADGIA